MKRNSIIVLIAFLLSTTAYSQKSEVFEFGTEVSSVNLIPYTEMFTDSTNGMTIEAINRVFVEDKFDFPEEKLKISFGSNHKNHWTVTQFLNDSSEEIDLVLDLGESALLDKVSWYIFENDSLIKTEILEGWKTAYYKRPLASRYQAIGLVAKPNKRYKCFVMVQRSVGVTSMVLNMNSKSTFYTNYLHRLYFSFFIFGTSIFLFFIVFALFVMTKRIVYLAFSLHAIVLFFHLFHRFGFFNMMHFEKPQIWMGPHGLFLSTTLLLVSTIFLMHQFIPFKKIMDARFLYIGYFFIALDLFYVFNNLNSYLSNADYKFVYFILVLTLVYILSLIFYGIFKKDKSSCVFFLAISYSLFVSLYIAFKLMSGQGYLNLYSKIFTGYFWEIVVFTTALVYQFIQMRNKALKLSMELSKSQDSIITLQEKERQIIATNLHDDLGGTLSALKGQVAIEGLENKSLHLIDKAIQELRSISRNLLPPEFAKYGLTEAIRHNISNLQNSTSIKFSFITYGSEVNFKTERKLNVYRIVSELANNIVKHAKAKNATIQLIYHKDYLFVSVEDNGSILEISDITEGIGLKSINSRLEYLQAKILQFPDKNGFTYVFEIEYKAPGISTL